jgi:putative lipoprotein
MTKTKTKRNTKEKDLAVILDSYTQNAELIEALEGFVEMRKRIKAPLTEHALSLLLKKLDGLGRSDAEKVEIVNQSVMNNWKGFFALKQEVKQHGTGRNDSREALEERYQDFHEADRDYIPPWEVRPNGGGDTATSG